MKKFAKMSLVAAVAVVGMTSANAGSLEEAIKGVDISGKVRYRVEEISNGREDQDVNIDVKFKVPVNDNVTFIANASLDNDNQEAATDKANLDAAVTDGKAAATDTRFNTNDNTDAKLDQYYFQYVNGAATVLAGTQPIPGRLTDALNGSGLVALYNVGSFTIGAATMYNNEATDEMLNSVIAMGSVGPVSLLAQYVNVDDTMDVYNVKADASIGPVMVGLEYSDKELDTGAATDDDRSTFKAYVSGKAGIVSAKLGYATTGDNGSGSIDGAAETPAEALLWQMGTKKAADMDMVWVDASVAVTDKISLRAAYGDAETGNVDSSEILGQVSYKMSKNLLTYLRVSELEEDNQKDVTRGRIEVKYTF